MILRFPGRGASPASIARPFLLALIALGVTFASPVRAADEDLPGRVGRVAVVGGELFLAPEEQASDWTGIGLNHPVTTGDNLWVSSDGRAEIDYGGGQFRLGGDTNVHVSRLDDHDLALFVAQGRVIVRVRVLDAGDSVVVDTPNTQVALNRVGLYRIDVEPDRETTTVVVREGEALLGLASGAQQALPGQTAVVAGIGATDADIRNGAGVDGFDTWSADRDRHYERARSTAYVSRQMIGYADLDANGVWETSPTYGPVWYPTLVGADWAPYRFGHWTWVSGFGYAWVDDAPWGYAPFHYGRWVHVGGRWGWCPGHYVAHPVWAPALVGWYGGPGWSVSMSFGGPVYGWVPLAWGEPYHPWWSRCSHNCWVRYNRPYSVNVAHRPHRPPSSYVNHRVPGAVTAVSASTLAGARPVATHRIPVQAASPPPVLASAPAVRPTPVGAPAVRAGSGGAPVPASTMYQAARPRPAPAAAPAGPTPPAARAGGGARQVAPAQAGSRPSAGPAYQPPAAAAPRAVEPGGIDPRQLQRQGPAAATPRNVQPATPDQAAPEVPRRGAEPRQRQAAPRQEGIPMPAAPAAPAPRAAAPAPQLAPVPRMSAPAPQPAPLPRMAAPAPQPAPVPRMAAPAPQPAPVPRMAAPAPQPVPTVPRAAAPAAPRAAAPAMPATPPAAPATRIGAQAAPPAPPPQAAPRGASNAPAPPHGDRQSGNPRAGAAEPAAR